MQVANEGTMQTTIPGVTACGLDVHRDKIEACVRVGDGSADGAITLRTFSTMRGALHELRDWLLSLNCLKVLMESTGVYWMPAYAMLEDVDGMNVGVGNSRDLKNAPGRPKTDKEDAKWLSRLCMFGLVLKSHIVGKPFRDLREYTRYHKKLVQERARQKNRIDKLLQMNGFKLSSVLSDITGASGLKILNRLADKGELGIEDIRAALHGRCSSTPEEVGFAINGAMKPTGRALLKAQLEKLVRCDAEIEEIYGHMLRLSSAHSGAVDIIASIPGMDTLSAVYVIAETGTDLSTFRTANHLASWAGLSPKENESAGKSRPKKTKKASRYVKSLLIQCAWAATRARGTRLSMWYWRNVNRLGDKKAITAVARRLICYIYAMLKSGTLYDTSLDVAYAAEKRAEKLDAAHKIIGSRKSSAKAFGKSGNDDGATLDGGRNSGIIKAPGRAGTKAESEIGTLSGVGSQEKTALPKKRGRPPKTLVPNALAPT